MNEPKKKTDAEIAEEELAAALETEIEFDLSEAEGDGDEPEISATGRRAAEDAPEEASAEPEPAPEPEPEPAPEPAPEPEPAPQPDPAPEAAQDAGSLDPKDAEIISLTAERDELKDKLLRALAEMENTRRRAERDRKDAETFGGTRLARDLLTVHDNLDRALEHADAQAKSVAGALIEGVELTRNDLLSAFSKHKIEKVVPAKGDKFDPNLHEAMFEAPIPGAEPGTVIEVMEAGFTIAGRLLRPARVGVARAG